MATLEVSIGQILGLIQQLSNEGKQKVLTALRQELGEQPETPVGSELDKEARADLEEEVIPIKLPLAPISDVVQAQAKAKAKEAYVMTLLAEGEISSGKAGHLLGISRLAMLDRMGQWGISRDVLHEAQSEETFQSDSRYTTLDEESKDWLEADLSGDLPDYDWGPAGIPEGLPIEYLPGKGITVLRGDNVE